MFRPSSGVYLLFLCLLVETGVQGLPVKDSVEATITSAETEPEPKTSWVKAAKGDQPQSGVTPETGVQGLPMQDSVEATITSAEEEPVPKTSWAKAAKGDQPHSGVTPGRLIPVSEATEDDLPTPDYRMWNIQQKVPVQQPEASAEVPEPIGVTTNQPTDKKNKEDEIVTAKTPVDVLTKETEVELQSKTENNKTQNNTDSNEEQLKAAITSTTTELPNDQTKEGNKYEGRVPVEEEVIKEVILPEICSITGIGCHDKPTFVESSSENTDVTPPIDNNLSNFSKDVSSEDGKYENTIGEGDGTENPELKPKFVSGETVSQTTPKINADENILGLKKVKIIHQNQQPIDSKKEEENEHKNSSSSEEENDDKSAEKESSEENDSKENKSNEDHENSEENGHSSKSIPAQSQNTTASDSEENSSQESHDNSEQDDDNSAESIPAQRRSEIITEESRTTTTEHNFTTTEKVDLNTTLTETSEEEKKLLHSNRNSRQNDEPVAESLSLGERIASYWKSATEYVSNVFNI